MQRLLWLIIPFLWISCGDTNPLEREYEVVGIEVEGLGKPTDFMAGKKAAALIYLSPECPLCRNYTVTIKKIMNEYSDQDVAFLGVVSGDFFSKSEVKAYLLKYDMDLPVFMDPEFMIARRYGAEITPEVHLIRPEGDLLYKGAIDNWAISLGQKRQSATRHYLADAIEAHLAGQPIDPLQTEAVGCYIE